MKKILAILSLVASIAAVNLSAMEPTSRGTHRVNWEKKGQQLIEDLKGVDRMTDDMLARVNVVQQHLGGNLHLQRAITREVHTINRRNEAPVARRRLDFGV